MTQLEIMTITGITGMLTGFSGAYPEELRNKCGQLNIDSNELYSIVTNPLYMQNGILTQAGEDRVRNFAGELKETIDSRRNALEADKEKHRLELSMLDHASFVLENLIAGNTYIYDMEQLPAADKAYYQLSNRLVTAENAEQLEQVEAMQDEYPLYKVGEISLASLKNHKQSQEALDLLKDALMREAGMENADGQVPDAGIHADGNNMIIEEEKEKGPAPESSEDAKTRFMELKEEEKRIDLEAVRAYQNIYYLTKGNKLDPMFMNAEELHGKDGFGGGTRGILNVVNSLDEKLFPEDVPAELEENRDKVDPDHFHLSSRTWTYEKEQEKKKKAKEAAEAAAKAKKEQSVDAQKGAEDVKDGAVDEKKGAAEEKKGAADVKKGSTAAKNPADLTYGQEAAMRQRKEQAMIAKARRTSDAEAKERADKTGRPEYVTGVSELREQQLKEKLETEKNLKSRKGSNLEQLGDNIVYEDPRKTIPAQELKSRIASLKRKLVLRKSLLQSVEEDRRAAAKAYKELPEQLSNASAFLSAKKEQVRTISKRLSRIRQNYTGDSTEYTEMKEAMDALISLDENSSVEQVSGAFSRLQQKARNYLSEKRGFLRYRALFHKRAGKECMAAAEDLVGLCDGAAEQFQQKKDNDASHEVQAEYQYFRRQLKNFAEMKIVPAVPSLEKTSARKPARAQAVKDMYHKLMQACRGLECDDPATRSILDRFDADRRNKVYQDIANAGLNDDDRLGQSIAAMETEINQQVYNEKTVLYNRKGKKTGQIGNRDLGSIRNRLVSKAAAMDDPQIPVEENGVQGMKTLKVGVRSMEELQRQFGQHYDENVERSDHFKYAQFKGRQFSHPLPRDMREEGSREDIRQQMNEVRQEQMNDRSKSKESGELSNRPTLP